MQTRHPQPLGFPSIRFGFWPIWTRCYETLRGLLGCRSCDRGLVVPYRSHGLADQELHVLILQSCWATSTPETFSTISSVRQPKAILACGESNFAGREVSLTWLGTMTTFSHWVPPSSQFNFFLASSFFRCCPALHWNARWCMCICLCIRGAVGNPVEVVVAVTWMEVASILQRISKWMWQRLENLHGMQLAIGTKLLVRKCCKMLLQLRGQNIIIILI